MNAIYIINYFKPAGAVVSERFVGTKVAAQDRAEAAVADSTAERVEIREPKSGNIIHRSPRLEALLLWAGLLLNMGLLVDAV